MKYRLVFTSITPVAPEKSRLHLEFNGVLCYLSEECKSSIDAQISLNLL